MARFISNASSKGRKLTSIFFTLAVIAPLNGAKAGEVGTITQISGKVVLMSHPDKKNIKGPAPHARFEGVHYSVQDAKIGRRVNSGNILRTSPGAKTKVIYDNGDHFLVDGATAYKVTSSSTKKPSVDLMFGKLRGVISKKGPRKNMRVRTRSATMGIRGTDFFIKDNGRRGGTHVSVLRGEVEMATKPKTTGKATKLKRVKIAKGETAEVKKTAPAAAKEESAPELAVRKTNKTELVDIQKSSVIKGSRKVDVRTRKELKKLESKALDMTLDDIKTGDPKLYAALQTKKGLSSSNVNSVVVKEVFQKAPEGPKKPSEDDLELFGEDQVYKKYFNID